MLCLEWLDPFYVGGHWVPEMVFQAGGTDVLGREREPSFRVIFEQIERSDPDIIVIMPCGYNSARAAAECNSSKFPEGWKRLRAVHEHRIFAVDANSYFSRPGPRLVNGVALLAHLFHPTLFPAESAPESIRSIEP